MQSTEPASFVPPLAENPFAPHSPAPPQAFVDRQREVDLILGHVRAAQRGNVAVNGPLGIGKTSLLRYVSDPAVGARQGVTPPEYLFVYLDSQSVTPFSADRFWRRIAQRLARLPASGLDAALAQLLDRSILDVVDLEELLDVVAEQGMVLVLLLDEFEWALRSDTPETAAASRDFLAQTASLARRSPRVLSLVVATEQPLHEVTSTIGSWRGSPFPTIFSSVTLKPLTREDADALADLALGDGTVRFSEADRQVLFAHSGGQPAAMQAAAFALFHGHQQGLAGEALWDTARSAAALALGMLTPHEPAPPIAAERPAEPAPGGGLWLDDRTGDVTVGQRPVESLTALEYNLLRLLYANPGRLCSKDDIIRQVWGEEFMGEDDDSRVEKLVSRLRRKIEPVPGRPQYIRTVRGRGYRLVP